MPSDGEHKCTFNTESKASLEKCRVCGHYWERDGKRWLKQNRADRRRRQRVWRAIFRRQTREADKRG